MRYVTLILYLTCVFTVSNIQGQEMKQQEKRQFAPVPREIMFPVIASQPDCPLQFEKAERLIEINKGGGSIYRLRNRSTKPIRSFTVSYTFDAGIGGSWGWQSSSGELVMPGQLAPSSWEDSDGEIIPLTEELRDKLKLRGPMQGFVIYMVERVEFADGTAYSDEAIAKALKAYLEEMSDKAYQAEHHK